MIGKIIVWLVVGALAGTWAGMLVKGTKIGFGRWTNLGVGLVGALIGGALFSILPFDFGLGQIKISLADLIAAFVGSLIFIFVMWILRRRTVTRPKGK